jgi:hypothetical protein
MPEPARSAFDDTNASGPFNHFLPGFCPVFRPARGTTATTPPPFRACANPRAADPTSRGSVGKVPNLPRLMLAVPDGSGLAQRRVAAAFKGRDLGDATGMAAALERGLQPGSNQLVMHLGADHLG